MASFWDWLSANMGNSGAPFGVQSPQEQAATPPTGLDNAVAGLGQTAWNAFTAPGNAYNSTPANPVTLDQMIKPAADLASIMVGAPGGAGGLGSGLRNRAMTLGEIPSFPEQMQAGRDLAIENYNRGRSGGAAFGVQKLAPDAPIGSFDRLAAEQRAGWNADKASALDYYRNATNPELAANPGQSLLAPGESFNDMADGFTLGSGAQDGRAAAALSASRLNNLSDQQLIDYSRWQREGIANAQANAAASQGPAGIRAYHGSPYDFDKFDLSKIGTGEGAQAYGHGLYFAENPKVAQDYRDSLSPSRGKLPDDLISMPPELRQAISIQAATDADPLTAAKRAQYMAAPLRADDPAKLADMIERARAAKQGRMYEVNINADPQQFLDWDKPLREQPQQAQNILQLPPQASRLNQRLIENGNPEMTGGQAYTEVRAASPDSPGGRGSQAWLSSQLSDAGIPGIKYLDQGSRPSMQSPFAADRNPPTQSHNYVVFNPSIIDILKKYGLAGLTAGAGVGALAPPRQAAPILSQ